MIARSTAAGIIRDVEDALHHLLKATTVRYEADAEDPVHEKLELMWLPTASVASLLGGESITAVESMIQSLEAH